jgi:hypothetical protein
MLFKLGRFSPLLSLLGVSGFTALAGCDSGESSYGGVAGAPSAGAPAGTGAAGASSSAGGSAGGSSAGTGGSSAGMAAGQGGGSGSGGAAGAGAGAGGTATGGTAAGAGGTAAGAGGTAAGAGGTAAGAGGTGGSSGSGGSAGGSSPCAYKLCEDFESGTETTLPAGWTSVKGYGTASANDQTVTTAQFHGGAKALQSNSAQKGISRIQKDLTPLGATASKHWGRIFYKVKSPAGQNPGGYLHVTFVSLLGTTENRVVDIVEGPDGKHQWLFNNPNDQGETKSAYDWTFDSAWHCAEWFVDVGANSYKFFWDSKEVPELAFTSGDHQLSAYKNIIVGATHYQDNALSAPFVVWFDDLAINDTQIGCK